MKESIFHKDVDILTVTGIVEPHSCHNNWVDEGGATQKASDELLERELNARSSEGKFGGAIVVRDASGNEIGRRGPAY